MWEKSTCVNDSKIKLTPDGKTVYEVYDVDNLVIPEGVTKIDRGAATQRMIVTVEIPDSVEEIGKEAFRICQYLQNIEYLLHRHKKNLLSVKKCDRK